MAARKSKKSETLQVRLPYGMKRDFMDRVKLENRSASDLIRDFIEGYLAGPVEILKSANVITFRKRVIYPSLIAASLAGAVILFMPNPGDAGNVRLEFETLDLNKDRVVTAEEFSPPKGSALLPPTRTPEQERAVPGPDGIVMYATDGTPLKRKIVIAFGPRPKPAEGEVILTVAQVKQWTVNTLDMNNDRALSLTEYKAARVRGQRRMFDRYDADLNEKVSADEYAQGAVRPFDEDRKAALTPEQDARLERSLAKQREDARARFSALDQNRDGTLTRLEMVPSL